MLTNVTPGTSRAIKYTLTTLYINKLWNRFDPPNTLDLLSLTTWNGVNMFLKFLVKQLRHWIFFDAIWLLHLGIQSKLHTKHWFALSLSMQLLFGIPIMKLRQKKGGESAEDSSQVDLQTIAEQELRRRYVGRTGVAISGGPQGKVLLNFLLQDSLWYSVS